MTAREVLATWFPDHDMHSVSNYELDGFWTMIDCSCKEELEWCAVNAAERDLMQAGLRNAPFWESGK